MSRFFVTGRILTQNLTPSPKYILHPPVPAWLFCFSHLQIWVLGSNPPDSHERCRDNNDPLLMSITWQKCSRQVGNHWSQHHTCSQLTFHPLKTSVTAGLFVRYCTELEGDSRVGRILDVVAALELVPTLKDTNLWMLQQRKIPKFQSNIWRSTISKSGNRYLSAVFSRHSRMTIGSILDGNGLYKVTYLSGYRQSLFKVLHLLFLKMTLHHLMIAKECVSSMSQNIA